VAPRTLLLLAVLAVALLGGAASAHARALEIGMASDATLLNGDPQEAREAAHEWKRLGIDVVRLQVQWSRVAPTPRSYTPPANWDPANPDAGYDWTDIDRAVRILAREGLRPMLMLDGPPPLWASTRPRAGNPRYQPSSWHFAQWAAATAKRYADVVEDYILWNEPNLPLWLQPQARCKGKRCTPISPHVYRFMVRAAYPAIHAADPTSRVLIGALAPTGGNLTSKNANMRPLQFIRALGCVDGLMKPVTTGACRGFQPAVADGFAYHPHSTKHPPHEGYGEGDNAALDRLGQVIKTLDLLQRAGRLTGSAGPLGLWLDEYAYQTNPPDKLRGVTPGRQDRYLRQAAYLAWRNPRVEMLTQYLWKDEPVGGGKRYTGWQSGLIDSEGDEKPALAHFDDPFWVDFERSVIWGQIRPGTEHDVTVQVRPAGAGTEWQSIARLRTAFDGTFFLRMKLQPFSAYRAVYEDGEVTGTAIAAPLSDASAGEVGKEVSEGLLVERRQAALQPGAAIPPSFAGLSIEWSSVPDFIGSGGVVNPIFARLAKTLDDAGSPPTLRFGGESTDHTWLNPTGQPKPTGIVTDIDQPWLAQLALWVRTTRTPLVLGLNMGLNDPGHAAAMAAALRGALGPAPIRAFELGNEPDLYATPRTYAVGKNVRARLRKREVGYGYPEYRQEINAHVAAVRGAVQDVGLSAGGFASGAWDDLQDSVLAREWAVRLWSVHAYPLQTCDPEIRRRGGTRYIPRLLAANAFTPIMDRARQLTAVAASYGGKVVFSEINSAICGGLRGVSDTMAAALWGTDILFGLASEGVRNVDFHGWTGSQYGPLEFTRVNGKTVGKVRPLFYGMLLFNRAAPPGSKLLPVGPNPPGGKLKTWGTIDRKGTRRFVVINKDVQAGRKVVLNVPGGASRARVERLVAPTLRSQNNVTLGGRGWGGSTADGRPKGKRKVERLKAKKKTFRLVVPAGSAALVEVSAAR
jgi:hypothetical protein